MECITSSRAGPHHSPTRPGRGCGHRPPRFTVRAPISQRAGRSSQRSSAPAARISPVDVGLPPGRRRGTPGLRREEVAQLSGVGLTWYTWLEQGRPIRVGVQVLDAVARALRLDHAELEHLYRLAGIPAPAAATVVAERICAGQRFAEANRFRHSSQSALLRAHSTRHHRRRRAARPDFHACRASPQGHLRHCCQQVGHFRQWRAASQRRYSGDTLADTGWALPAV